MTPLPSRDIQEDDKDRTGPADSGGASARDKAVAAEMRKELAQFRLGQNAAPFNSRHVHEPSPAERLRNAPLRMDHKKHRKLSQGKLAPQARLDLHGMTLNDAHPELIRFVLSCHANDLRLVLVITGKGRGDHGPLPTRPGALRHQVPFWLHAAPLGAVVQQVTPAHYRHGGEGAYYVYLRRGA